jgi:hypothetical protein
MLVEIFNPNQRLPSAFAKIQPVLKLKTKYLEHLKIEQPSMDSEDEPILLIRMPQDGYTAIRTISYGTADIITKKGLKDVVPLILVLQDFNQRLYLALTYVKFWAPEPAVKPNQLELF